MYISSNTLHAPSHRVFTRLRRRAMESGLTTLPTYFSFIPTEPTPRTATSSRLQPWQPHEPATLSSASDRPVLIPPLLPNQLNRCDWGISTGYGHCISGWGSAAHYLASSNSKLHLRSAPARRKPPRDANVLLIVVREPMPSQCKIAREASEVPSRGSG